MKTNTLFILCSLLTSSLYTMHNTTLSVRNNTQSRIGFLFKRYSLTDPSKTFSNCFFIDEQTTEIIALPKPNNGRYTYHLKIPHASPRVARMEIGPNKNVQLGDYLEIAETENDYQIIKRTSENLIILAMLNKQCNPIFLPADARQFGTEIVSHFPYDKISLHNLLKNTIKIKRTLYQNNIKMSKTTYYLHHNGKRTVLPEDKIIVTGAFQQLHIPTRNKYMNLYIQLSEDNNYIVIKNTKGDVMAKLFMKNTMFNIDTQEAEPLSI